MYKSKLFLIILVLHHYTSICLAQKLNVHVLYESLCPDSIKFVKEQLYTTWKELSPYVNLKFVPFGKSASLENGTSFICQHGPRECLGNRIQSCALDTVQDQDIQVEYVNCFMNTFKKQNTEFEFGQMCAVGAGINWESVAQCHDSELGTKLQLEAEQITVQISPSFVPTILYDGKFNQQAQDDSLTNFRGVACSFITQRYPEACQT